EKPPICQVYPALHPARGRAPPPGGRLEQVDQPCAPDDPDHSNRVRPPPRDDRPRPRRRRQQPIQPAGEPHPRQCHSTAEPPQPSRPPPRPRRRLRRPLELRIPQPLTPPIIRVR